MSSRSLRISSYNPHWANMRHARYQNQYLVPSLSLGCVIWRNSHTVTSSTLRWPSGFTRTPSGFSSRTLVESTLGSSEVVPLGRIPFLVPSRTAHLWAYDHWLRGIMEASLTSW